MKNESKRVKNDARISYAERKRFRLKVKNSTDVINHLMKREQSVKMVEKFQQMVAADTGRCKRLALILLTRFTIRGSSIS